MKTIIESNSMNYKNFSIIALFSLLSPLAGCSNCSTQVSQNDPDLATRTVHPPKSPKCTCQCTVERNEKGECTECGHRVIEPKRF